MVNAMDRSYADQSTLHGEDPMAVTFMDSHNYNNRCRFLRNTAILIIFNLLSPPSHLFRVWSLYSYDFLRFLPHNTDKSLLETFKSSESVCAKQFRICISLQQLFTQNQIRLRRVFHTKALITGLVILYETREKRHIQSAH